MKREKVPVCTWRLPEGVAVRVDSLKIENFRGVREGFVRFKKHAVLIGGNNVGKTTVIEALTLLLGRDRLIRELTEHDFYGSNPQPSDRIKLIATIVGFPGDDPELNSNWFREGRAVVKWLDDATGVIHNLRENQQRKLCCQIALQARFDHDSLAVETVRYFHDHDGPFDPFVDETPAAIPMGLVQQFGYYLVRASRTWDRVFSWGSELFRRTVNAAAAQPSSALLAERDRLRDPAQPIENDPQIAPLIARVNAELGRSFATTSVQLRLTGTDSRSVMEAVQAHFTTRGGPSVPAARQGSGLVSMQGLLLLLELGRMRDEAGDGFVLALEEPELHLPPAAQQQLVQRVQALSTQTFVTTHSPLVASMADPTSVLVLRNNGGTLSAEPFLRVQLAPEAANWERRFFQHSRIDVLAALMQPAILIPEGKADFHLLRAVLRPLMLTEGWIASMLRPFGVEVGLLPTEDAKVVQIFQNMARLHAKSCCIVDGDQAGLGYIESLKDLPSRPAAIIRWHDGAMIEDVVGWVLAADADGVMNPLTDISPGIASVDDFVAHLKTKKVDLVTYEAVAEVIVDRQLCRERAAELFGSLGAAIAGTATDRFRLVDEVWVFQP